MEKENARLREALRAMVIFVGDGQPCYRTSNGVPMGMPKRIERIVRKCWTPADAVESR